jgi:hypothetical protein
MKANPPARPCPAAPVRMTVCFWISCCKTLSTARAPHPGYNHFFNPNSAVVGLFNCLLVTATHVHTSANAFVWFYSTCSTWPTVRATHAVSLAAQLRHGALPRWPPGGQASQGLHASLPPKRKHDGLAPLLVPARRKEETPFRTPSQG